jgi:hypothetical protein
MSAAAGKPSAAGSSSSRPLPLESGDFMHSREFLCRYERMPQVKKAELIEGVVNMGSPVSAHHGKPDALIQAWLVTYASRHPETEAYANTTLILDAENTVQPDALSRRLTWVATRLKMGRRPHLAWLLDQRGNGPLADSTEQTVLGI